MMNELDKLFLIIYLVLLASYEGVHPASFLHQLTKTNSILDTKSRDNTFSPELKSETFLITKQSIMAVAAQYNSTTTQTNHQFVTTTSPTTTITTITTTTLDPNMDPEDLTPNSTPPSDLRPTVTLQSPNDDKESSNKTSNNNATKNTSSNNRVLNFEMTIFFFSVFLLYVSCGKLIYHNVGLIKRNMTEPGILMIFGIVWELVSIQVASNDLNPRFNSRIFFYLFLPSTVLESASLLSNKWLFLNMLPILVHSIMGTLLYASSMGFTIYSLSRQNLFNLGYQQSTPTSLMTGTLTSSTLFGSTNKHYQNAYNSYMVTGTPNKHHNHQETYNVSLIQQFNQNQEPSSIQQIQWAIDEFTNYSMFDKSYSTTSPSVQLNNLTLADCLVFGTILSSVDSTTMLNVLRILQVNERLYYLVLGEGLMNNAVVLIILNLLLDFFNETRLTVVKIYIKILQFFITLIGSVFVGLLFAGIALVLVRLIKRFQVPTALTSYQNQCQAMVETLLILKFAYLTYTLAAISGTSSIVSLATFGILQDQYIVHNLNLRSQLTLRQVTLATRTMGYSLIYPLLGMLLVEVASNSQFFQNWLGPDSSIISPKSSSSLSLNNSSPVNNILSKQLSSASNMLNAASIAASKLTDLANQANLYGNYKFLSFIILMTMVYRFIWVILLSLFCNLFSSNQLKIKFKEQILVAFGGLKGPLAFAIIHKLMEQEDYRDHSIKNKHLFVYTILLIVFISTIVKGPFIRPLVSKIQATLIHHSSQTTNKHQTSIVFDEINSRVTEYISHGLNSILGHTKSPYDRFVELNETHIKPWLTRSSCDTNWLSVFYDKLILDETLNANCFYRSIGVIDFGNCLVQRLDRKRKDFMITDDDQNNAIRNDKSLSFIKKRRSSSLLDTINENTQASIKTRNVQLGKLPLGMKSEQTRPLSRLKDRALINGTPSTQPLSLNRQLSSEHQDSDSKCLEKSQFLFENNKAQNDKGVLKEFVMFNLKLEESRRRKQSLLSGGIKMPSIKPLNWSSDLDSEIKAITKKPNKVYVQTTNKLANMLSSSGSGALGVGVQDTSSFEMATKVDKQRHLAEMERAMNMTDNNQTRAKDPNVLETPKHRRRRKSQNLNIKNHLAEPEPNRQNSISGADILVDRNGDTNIDLVAGQLITKKSLDQHQQSFSPNKKSTELLDHPKSLLPQRIPDDNFHQRRRRGRPRKQPIAGSSAMNSQFSSKDH